VVICGRDARRGQAVVDEVRQAGGDACFAPHDLEDPDSGRSVARAARAAFGPVELLVNSAGTFFQAAFEEVTAAEFDRAIQINVRGAFLLTQALVAGMAARGYGRVVFISSTASDNARAGSTLYGTTKAALNGLMHALVPEYGPFGVTFNTVSPGLIPTPLTGSVLATEEGRASYAEVHANRRVGRVEEVAHVVLGLLDENAGHTISQNIAVDGGMSRIVRHAAPPPPEAVTDSAGPGPGTDERSDA
jgi:NAD(P)-dependent dehydrogenase (short-subunit alcohol dehydrogenase family)